MSEYYQFKNNVLTFGDEISVVQAAELYEGLTDYLNAGETELSIDASAVEKVDGALLQLMVSFIHEYCDEKKSEIKWVSPSKTFVHAAKTLGLESSLHLH